MFEAKAGNIIVRYMKWRYNLNHNYDDSSEKTGNYNSHYSKDTITGNDMVGGCDKLAAVSTMNDWVSENDDDVVAISGIFNSMKTTDEKATTTPIEDQEEGYDGGIEDPKAPSDDDEPEAPTPIEDT